MTSLIIITIIISTIHLRIPKLLNKKKKSHNEPKLAFFELSIIALF